MRRWGAAVDGDYESSPTCTADDDPGGAQRELRGRRAVGDDSRHPMIHSQVPSGWCHATSGLRFRSVCTTTDGTARAVPSPGQAACRRRSVGESDVTGSLLLSASMGGVVERWRTR